MQFLVPGGQQVARQLDSHDGQNGRFGEHHQQVVLILVVVQAQREKVRPPANNAP